MKKYILLASIFLTIVGSSSAQSSIIEDVFKDYINNKVLSIQKIIDFTDEQAEEIKLVEFEYLKEVNAAENCFLCNKKRRIKKLKNKKESRIKEILDLNQYIKYDALENDKIKKHPIWLER